VGVDKHCVIPAWIQPARLGEGGRDIDVVPADAERALDQDPHLLDVIDDENPQASRSSWHCVNLSARPAPAPLFSSAVVPSARIGRSQGADWRDCRAVCPNGESAV
jgi:hypothetical protein